MYLLLTRCDLGAMLHFGDIPLEHQYPNTTIVGEMINFQSVPTLS